MSDSGLHVEIVGLKARSLYEGKTDVVVAIAGHIGHYLTTLRKNCKSTIFPIIDRGRNSKFSQRP